MRILDKYSIKNFIPPAVYCLASFLIMYILIDLFSHLDEILRNKVGVELLLKYYYMLLPIIFVQVMPVVILLAVVYVFSDMNKHNEITAMKSSGISVGKIIWPFLLVGIFVSLIVMLTNELIVPNAFINTAKIKQNNIEKVKGAHEKNAVLNDVALYGEGNRLIYIKEFNVSKRKLDEIIIFEHDSSNNPVTKIAAESGRWENIKGTGPRWAFYNCIIYRLKRDGELIGKPIIFQRKIMDIKETPKDLYQGQFQAELMNFSQLYEYVKKFYKVDKRIARKLAVDLYYKTSFPFINFIVVLLGVGFGLTSRRGGAMWGIGISMALGLLYYAALAISLALGKGGLFHPLLAAWNANIIFLVVGIALIKKLAN